jgi:hypothetical protein
VPTSRAVARALRLAAPAALVTGVAAAQALYARGWDNGFVSDDWNFLHGAATLTDGRALLRYFSFDDPAFVRPTQWLLVVALHRLFGLAPAGYHVVSQALDLANAALAAGLAWQLLALAAPALRPATRRGLAALTALGFLLSWRHHEAVFWFSAVNEPLAAAFRLTALNLVAWWLRIGRRFPLVWLGTLGAAGLAMLSKESAAVLPLETLLLVGLARAAGPRPFPPGRQTLALVAAPLLVVTAWTWVFVRSSVGAPGGVARGASQTLAAAPGEWALRLVQFFNANYPTPAGEWTAPAALAAELAVLGGLAVVAAARRQPLWLFALGWTVVAAIPYAAVSHGPDVGLVPVLELGVRGDRFLYYPALGAALLVTATGVWLEAELAAARVGRRGRLGARAVALGIVVVLLAAQAARLYQAESQWGHAGRIVRQVTTGLPRLWPDPRPGEMLCLAGLPHTYNGTPVYRNGVAESLFLAYRSEGFAVERFENLRDAAARARCTATFVYAGPARGVVRARVVTGGAAAPGGGS